MTRREVLDSMPKEIQDKVYTNMVNQDEWKKIDNEDYKDEIEFIMSAFTFHRAFEPMYYWEDYITHLMYLDTLLDDCINDE